MRPILKGSSRKRSPNKSPSGSTGASPQKKREAVGFESPPPGRRVTFSPFAKPRRRLQPKRLQSDREDRDGVVTSGFAFSAADEREVKRAARRKRDMSIMQTLYNAASKPRLSWHSLVDDHLAFLKPVQVKFSHWLRVVKEPFLAEARRRHNRRVLRSRTRHAPPVFFDQSDRQYQQSVSAPLLPPTRIIAADQALKSAAAAGASHCVRAMLPPSPLIEPHAHAQPDLTPIHHGSLSTLLRKEGIPATEDESRDKAAVRNDLRGVTHRSSGLKIVPCHQKELHVV